MKNVYLSIEQMEKEVNFQILLCILCSVEVN